MEGFEMSIKEHIDRWMDEHEREYLEDVKRLVAIRSVKGEAGPGMPYGEGPAAALAEAAKMCRGYGFEVSEFDGHAIAADMNPLTPGVDMLAHLDVVGEGDGWDTEPYTPTVKGDLLYGRGTSDDKGPAVAALYAMRCIQELGIPLKKNARLILGTDEESGSEDMEYYYSVQKPAPCTFSPDACFPICNTEKGRYAPRFVKSWEAETVSPRIKSIDGGFRINVIPADASAVVCGISAAEVEKTCSDVCGRLNVSYRITENDGDVSIKVTGVGAHASMPEVGNNGITALIALLCALPLADCESARTIKRLGELFPHGDGLGKGMGVAMADELSGELTLTLDLLSFTETGADGQFDSRVPICATEENCRTVIVRKLEDCGFTVSGTMSRPHHTPADSPFVKCLLDAYESFTGEKGECFAMGGGTYVHDVEGGVAFGAAFPGFEHNEHGANEKMSISSMIKAAKVYALSIYEICK